MIYPDQGLDFSTYPSLTLNIVCINKCINKFSFESVFFIFQGKAHGNTCALWLRGHLQTHLFNLGCFIQKHCRKVLFLGLLVLSLCCVGLKTATIETDVEKLWVEGKF